MANKRSVQNGAGDEPPGKHLDVKAILYQTGSTRYKFSRAAEAEARHVVLYELAIKRKKFLEKTFCDIIRL